MTSNRVDTLWFRRTPHPSNKMFTVCGSRPGVPNISREVFRYLPGGILGHARKPQIVKRYLFAPRCKTQFPEGIVLVLLGVKIATSLSYLLFFVFFRSLCALPNGIFHRVVVSIRLQFSAGYLFTTGYCLDTSCLLLFLKSGPGHFRLVTHRCAEYMGNPSTGNVPHGEESWTPHGTCRHALPRSRHIKNKIS